MRAGRCPPVPSAASAVPQLSLIQFAQDVVHDLNTLQLAVPISKQTLGDK
jgi:hypothetical protein